MGVGGRRGSMLMSIHYGQSVCLYIFKTVEQSCRGALEFVVGSARVSLASMVQI